ncbi:MAG TPA: hypothetical protein VJH65_01860 [Candidatus Nanoarchaeia archaeon]|nr:hypothetical protein [Candidatus Nanoarchaeia archaeon]
MEEKKSLTKIIGESIIFSAVSYSVYSILYAAISQDVTFAEKLKDPLTFAFACGMGMGYFIERSVQGNIK